MMELVKVNSEEEIKNSFFLPKDIDRFEINASNKEDILQKFLRYYQVSEETVFIKCKDEVIGIYGVREENNYTGIPWLLTADIPRKYAMSFLRLSIMKFKELQKKYKILYNYTSSENLISQRWLRFLGFTVDTTNPLVISDEKSLYKFEWRSE